MFIIVFVILWLILGQLGLHIYRTTAPDFYKKFGIVDLIVIEIAYSLLGGIVFVMSLIYRYLHKQ